MSDQRILMIMKFGGDFCMARTRSCQNEERRTKWRECLSPDTTQLRSALRHTAGREQRSPYLAGTHVQEKTPRHNCAIHRSIFGSAA